MDLRRIIIIALFSALMVAGAYIAIPVGPVPITLQTMFVLLAGILGGRRIGAASVAVYLALGAIGLPVFSGGVGGFGHFAGPTGGFLLSWLIAAPLAGLCTDIGFRKANQDDKVTKGQLLWIILGATVATIVLYAIGIPYLKTVLDISWGKSLAIGLIPFLPGDLLKLVATVLLGNLFSLRVRQFLTKAPQEESFTDETGS
ncbi:biotin transporter BioY [Pleomorphochaeta sp. DL1XJH-081]|jgi:biotin transport system substrate-specific component|uniref:biotin transporter BioY n=1 Tax=Pleomorphochaeta sp. DL1XJH-081 TaxID=3409690 RepID=UPI003BB491BD